MGQLFQTMDMEYQIMDMNEFESKWRMIRGRSKVWWNLITDSDLHRVEKADIKFFEFVTILQLKYGLDRQFAKDEIGRRVAEFETRFETINTPRP
jgi:hypothetical protein